MCSATFNRRDLLMKHLETHDKTKQVSSVVTSNTTQKLLQETIDEALRETTAADISAKNIQFHSCDTCSVTFLNEALYLQHMKQHKTNAGQSRATSGAGQKQRTSNNGSYSEDSSSVAVKQEQQQNAGMSDDLESIFERMHADKAEINANAAANSENMVITQENTSSGGITFNITIPQSAVTSSGEDESNSASNQQQISIDMPTLDGDLTHETKTEAVVKSEEVLQAPVSMPSLDDDQDGNTQESHVSNTDAVPMELDEIQSGADGQQIKFILNENGQILSLDNHILTTDMDGNQILVQGTDMEQLQALLQSGGVVMQGEDGMGEGQQILVQGTDMEQLQALIQSGNVVMQGEEGIGEGQQILVQGTDMEGLQALIPSGELNAEGTHITTEDGIQIPVSITFGGAEGDQITVQEGTEGSEEQMQLLQQQQEADQAEHHEGGQTLMLLQQGATSDQQEEQDETSQQEMEQDQEQTGTEGEGTDVVTSEANTTGNNEGFLNFDELIQPQIINKVSKQSHFSLKP